MSQILIVEDELAIAEAVQLALTKAGHFSEIVAFGETAIERLSAPRKAEPLPYELLILDIGLPDLSGFEVCRRIRLLYAPEQLPVLFLTAHNEEIDRVLGLELSGGDYLTKPFSLRELVTRVRLLLGRRRPAAIAPVETPAIIQVQVQTQAHALRAGENRQYLDFEWNENEAWATFRSQKLALTITEYRLLLAFLNRPRQVFSRQQLLDSSRGETHPSGERTIDTHIKSLRSKLREQGPAADIIITHRGLGYSIE